jgi:hypothetical protein
MADNILTGARGIIKIQGVPVGLFTQISWGQTDGLVPNHIVGAEAPAELTSTHQDAIAIDCTGFHILQNFVFSKAGMPQLKNLLSGNPNNSTNPGTNYITITVEDKVTGQEIMSVSYAKAFRWGTQLVARDVSTFTVSFLGRFITTSDNLNDGEPAGSASLPTDGTTIA